MSSLTSELEQLPQQALLTAGFITYLGHVSATSELVLLYCTADSYQTVSSTYVLCMHTALWYCTYTCSCIHYVGLECVEPVAGLNTPTVYVFVFL